MRIIFYVSILLDDPFSINTMTFDLIYLLRWGYMIYSYYVVFCFHRSAPA
jgi:hypothetical protein